MNKADRMEPAYLSSLFGPESSWGPDYDVAERMAELENFWAAGVTAALYDALKHQEWNPHIEPPKWILDASIKVVEDRLRAGFETKQKLGKGTTSERYINRKLHLIIDGVKFGRAI